jgi:hypothetical protein
MAPTLTRAEQNSSQVALTGAWSANSLVAHSGSSAVLSMDAGSKATFTFNGTGANWIAYRDEWSGIARVYVDGKLLGEVDTYAAPSAANTKAYSVTALTAGTHTLTIEATGTKRAASGGAWVWVDAFEAAGSSATTSATTSAPAPPLPTLVTTAAVTPVRIEQDNNAAVKFRGDWTLSCVAVHSGGIAKFSMTAGARVTLTFTGTAVSWIGYRDEWSGIARVTLDGGPVTNVDTYMDTARSQAVIYSLTNLAPKTHTLVIEVSGLKNASAKGSSISIDAFDVTP